MKKVFCTHESKGRSFKVTVDRWIIGSQKWTEYRCSDCGRIWRVMRR